MRSEEKLTISDGRTFTLRAPGMGFELEAFGAIPDLGDVFAEIRKGRTDEQDEGKILALGELLILHGVKDPKLDRAAVRDLLEPDFQALSYAIGKLRGEAIAAAAAHYRPTVAGSNSSAPSDKPDSPSDAGPRSSSGSSATSATSRGSSPA